MGSGIDSDSILGIGEGFGAIAILLGHWRLPLSWLLLLEVGAYLTATGGSSGVQGNSGTQTAFLAY